MDDTEFRMIMSKLTDINNTLHRIGKEGGNEIRKINITVEKIFQSVEYKIKSIDHNCYKLNDIESYLEEMIPILEGINEDNPNVVLDPFGRIPQKEPTGEIILGYGGVILRKEPEK